jgi:hypothetical protein
MESSPEVAAAIADVRSDSTPTDICMFGYEGACVPRIRGPDPSGKRVHRALLSFLRLPVFAAITQA